MTEAKHTPGPWFRDKESGFDCDVRAANGRKIAAVNVQCTPRTKQQFDGRKAENNANALLIAAAPDLLEALIDAEKKLVELEHMVGGGDDEVYVEGAILNARAAIAKATGN